LLSVSSLTKSYGLAGLRCGWVIGAPPAIARIRRVRDVIDNIGAAPADRLSTLAFAQIDALGARAAGLLSANLDVTRAFFAEQPRLEIAVALAATVTFPRLRGVADTQPLVTRLFETTGVAVAPGHFFGAPDHFRISLAGRTADLREGLACLGRVLEQV
jgi:aspartate/methionine/tyrosine aminotransferase